MYSFGKGSPSVGIILIGYIPEIGPIVMGNLADVTAWCVSNTGSDAISIGLVVNMVIEVIIETGKGGEALFDG